MEDVLFEFYIGRTYTRDLEITWNKEIEEMYFTVKSAVDDKAYVLQKTLGNGILLVEKTVMEDGSIKYLFNITIEATDTDKMDIDKDYVFDVALVSGVIKQTAITGTLRLNGTATATNNEKEG